MSQRQQQSQFHAIAATLSVVMTWQQRWWMVGQKHLPHDEGGEGLLRSAYRPSVGKQHGGKRTPIATGKGTDRRWDDECK